MTQMWKHISDFINALWHTLKNRLHSEDFNFIEETQKVEYAQNKMRSFDMQKCVLEMLGV